MKPLALAKTPRLNFAERRRLILETAASLFAERGFEGTTTRAIALECGINEALIFRHFKTKEELYTSLLEQKLEDFAEKIGPALRKILKFPLKPGLLEIANLVVRKHQEDT
ncbi:MAG TPA: hypothetical protein DF383_05095, partial [Deltaproteobacteria bacterium]|nr:hypothetical protein [Deltaproteobacteria bacterium]